MAPLKKKSNLKKKAAQPSDASPSKPVEEDERFVMDAARFNKVPLAVRKVELDDRFSKVLTDKKFSSGGDMKRFYAAGKKKDLESEDEDEDEQQGVTGSGFVWNEVSSDSEGASSDEEDASEVEWDKYNDEAEKANVWSYGDDDESKKLQGDATSRVAVLGLNWDEAEASDIFVMFQTFLDSTQKSVGGGATRKVKRVRIFPSDYGLKRLEIEKVRGPVLDSDVEDLDAGESSASDTDEEPDMEAERLKKEKEIQDPKAHLAQLALRKYQRQRTKYYYAIAEFDSRETGDLVYNELDGIGASFCSMMMDLRFVPDELEEFPHPPTSTCTEMPKKYQKTNNDNQQAQSHTNAKCSWDEPAPERRFLSKKLTPEDIAEIDLDAYLASSSDEESDINEDNVEDYRKQLLGGELSEDDDKEEEEKGKEEGDSLAGEMTFKFNTSTQAMAEEVEARASALKESGQLGRAGLAAAEKKSPWEQYLDKRKQKDKVKREKRLQARMAAEDEDAKATKAEAGRQKEELELITGHKESEEGPEAKAKDMEVNVNDPRFTKMFEDTAFAIDPTHPEFKKTKAMSQLMDARIERKKQMRKRSRKPTSGISKSKVSNLDKRLGPAADEGEAAAAVDLKADGMKLLGRAKKRRRSSKK
ncbi:pre-rRNA-processing protein esf1 [Perkinsus chesapeaki]|uniref:Pre-rRNA-processing protein esf1 n=1 Tax=Perkinsus chesapeaki TaxID=330153 RepID=A0A7J6MJX5_PERCH|nr:pre-rRNA-processing protein esf1 [Perkinsus chesapeaki]